MDDFQITVTIEHRLRHLMADVGCKSISELARETSIHPNTLRNLDNMKNTNLTLENVSKLLWFFNCKFEDLFVLNFSTNEPDDHESLSDDVKKAIATGRSETDDSDWAQAV